MLSILQFPWLGSRKGGYYCLLKPLFVHWADLSANSDAYSMAREVSDQSGTNFSNANKDRINKRRRELYAGKKKVITYG
ncbi:hypothetical protein Leryth_022692 [Lithospermum erythrorhizon]|nr:hypothetical protein Leryth_022692 [Lithospermum erythrorhizon]